MCVSESLCVCECVCLGEGVNSEDGQIGLRLGVVHEIEVDQLLQLKVVGLHAIHHIRKQRANTGRKEGLK